MATAFHVPVTAAQVGTYFVGQYYGVLQQQPEFVHQFYSDASTMLRIDGNTRETATAILQIHTLAMSLNYTGIQIKTVHSLESWNGGVLVLVCGAVHTKNSNGRRKFVQTFFLAPLEKGYFVLSDIFQFTEDDLIHQLPVTYLPQSNLDTKLNASATIREPVSNYMLGVEAQPREFASLADFKENGPVEDYSFSEQRLQHVPEAGSILEDNFVQSNGSTQNTVNPLQDHPSPAEGPAGEPQKHTYASILQVTKGQSVPPAPSQTSFNKSLPAPEWNHVPEPPQQSVASSAAVQNSGPDAADEGPVLEEGEIKSVYVRNLPPTVSASEIEEEFKKFGKLGAEAVAIRNRKDIGVCYAFVEFEDISGVQNAIKEASVRIAGNQVFIEGRRANRLNATQGGRRGRGRGGFQSEAPRGRYGAQSFGRGSGQDGGDRDYNRPRGNGY